MKFDVGQSASDDIEAIANSLHKRVMEETERLLSEQLKTIGVDLGDPKDIVSRCQRYDHVDDPLRLSTYFYDGIPILGLRAGENMMSIEFDIYNLNSGQNLN